MTKRLVLAAVLTLLVSATAAASVHFLPDTTRDQFAPGQPSRALPTWQLPEGLLVVDRRGPGQSALGGEEMKPRFEDGEWYLVDRPRAAREGELAPAVDPATLGHVHLTSETAWVVEVPRAQVDAFLAAGLRIQYLDRAPLAPAQAPDSALRRIGLIGKTIHADESVESGVVWLIVGAKPGAA